MRKAGKLSQLSDAEFAQIVADCTTVLQIMKLLGYCSTSGGVQANIAQRIKNLNFDTSHFGFVRYKLPRVSPRHDLSHILVEDSTYLNRASLKRRLVSEGVLKYECGKCGNAGYWQGELLALQLDHKNGVYNDHRIENIWFLCPNCHSQTPTYCGRNIKKDV